MTESSGRYGPVGPRSSDRDYAEIKELITALKVQMQHNAGEIGEIKKQVQGFSRVLTSVETTLPNLVTKADCSESRSAINKDQASLVQDLKDRMEGRREVTGVHQTLPEMLAEQLIAERKAEQKDPILPPSKPEGRGVIFYVKAASAIIGVLTFLFGAAAFINHTLDEQQETVQRMETIESLLRANANQYQPPAPDKSASAQGER